MRSSPWRTMVGSSVPVSSMRRRITSIDCSTVRCLSCVRPASVYPIVRVEPSALSSIPSVSTDLSCSRAVSTEPASRRVTVTALFLVGEIGVADVRLAQHGAGVVQRGGEPLRDQLVHADLEQQVRAALQVEAERHRLLREPARHRIERGARHEAGDRQHRADQQHDEDDCGFPGREMQHGWPGSRSDRLSGRWRPFLPSSPAPACRAPRRRRRARS